jgi:predicted phage terminase large subunit-like protein
MLNTELTPLQRAERRYTAVTAETCRRSLRKFVRRIWHIIDPKPYVEAWHIDAICDHLAYVAIGDIKNLMLNIGPRMTKSSIVSVAFPAWVWTDEENASLQFLCASYAKDLAEGDAMKMRRVILSEWYQARYPHIVLLGDQNRADDFRNVLGGYRQSISVGGRTTGLGGDIQIGDDFHNAATIESDAIRKGAVHWHDNSWRSRVNDPNNARRIYCGQRTHDGDIYGHVLAREEKRWVHLNLPMEYDKSRPCITFRNKGEGPIGAPIFRDPRTVPNSLLCPARFDEKVAAAEKEAIPKRTWDAQYQQQPEGAGGVILKRHWWRRWEWPEWHPEFRKSERPLPEVVEIIQAYDTAFEQSEQDSYTVRTTWGLFEHSETLRLPNGITRQTDPRINAILLERKKWRPTFGEMRDDAEEANKTWGPDRILVEKKASGHSLIQELRRKDLPIRAVKVFGDLVYRAHMSSLPLEKGAIWYITRNWSKDVIEECAKFPNVDFNDQVSSCTIAWQYMRRYMDLQIEDEDDNEELDLFSPDVKRVHSYYG